MTPTLQIEHISKTFNPGTVNEKPALRDLSLTVPKGDFITIIGANGAGKSTLFNMISGNYLTDEGNIFLEGDNITMDPPHKRARRIGRLYQDPTLGTAPGMSIEENLELAAGVGGWFTRITSKDRERFREHLSVLDMGLEDRLKQPVGLLSGGQRQALALMMTTINPPTLLLLDEHTAALDPGAAEKILNITKQIVREDNLTCLMVTHNMTSALELGNRTIMMDAGQIIFDVSGQERDQLTVPDLLDKFKEASGRALDNDRMLLTKD